MQGRVYTADPDIDRDIEEEEVHLAGWAFFYGTEQYNFVIKEDMRQSMCPEIGTRIIK